MKKLLALILIVFMFGCAGVQVSTIDQPTQDFIIMAKAKTVGFAMRDNDQFIKYVKEGLALLVAHAPNEIMVAIVPDVIEPLIDKANLDPTLEPDIKSLLLMMGIDVLYKDPRKFVVINLDKFKTALQGLYKGLMLEVA